MKRRFVILGLSNYGYFLAESLQGKETDIIVADADPKRVDLVKDFVEKPLIGDATNKDFLKELNISDADYVVVSLGDSLEASILCTMHLKELNAKNVIVKANNPSHVKILKKLGADHIVFPEQDMARHTANRIKNPDMLDMIRLSKSHVIVEVPVPDELAEKPLKELQLTAQYNVSVMLIKNSKNGEITLPNAEYILKDYEILFLLGEIDSIKKFTGKFADGEMEEKSARFDLNYL